MTKADQDMLLELARKFIRAWDPDDTKLTPREAEERNQSVKDLARCAGGSPAHR